MSSADPHTYRPLDGGWRVAEDSHGRTYFINEAKGTTSWYDPRHDVKYLKKFDNKGPNVVRIGFALHELQQNNGFSQVNEAKLQSVLEKKEGSKSEANLKRDGLRALVQEAVDKNDPSVANKITDRLMSLFDVKHEGVVEYRIATLGLIFLSTMKTYRKFQLAFLVLDTTRSNRLDQSSLFAMFKTITKLIENPYYRYKLAISNRNLISDVVSCLQTVKITKGRANDGTITFPEFVSYAIDDPLILRPLSMLEKIQVSRNTTHSGKKCGSCQKAITGIRYKSQDSFNMCEDCFWKGIETAQFKKKDAFYEYPTEHTAQEKASEKVSGHYVPTMMRSGRARDDEALRPEQIDPAGNFLDPTSASRSGSTTNF